MPIELSAGDTLGGLPLRRWRRAARKVALLGSRPRTICCPECESRAGRLYERRDRRILCWTLGGGAHPRCRHWLAVAAPGAASPGEGTANPALAAAARLAREGKALELKRLLARTSRSLLRGKEVRLPKLTIELEP